MKTIRSVVWNLAALTFLTWLSVGCAAPEVSEQSREEQLPLDRSTPSIPLQRSAIEENASVQEILIEIQGAVNRPGVYPFEPGTRLHEAIERAGGATEFAEIRDINIAARLVDGSVLSIPFQQQPRAEPVATAAQLNPPRYTRSGWRGGDDSDAAPSAGNDRQTNDCVNLNTATQQELETLPGIGPKTAAKILFYRSAQPFARVEDLRNISGIGEKHLESLRGLVCL